MSTPVEGFPTFWDRYPRRVARLAAEKAYRKAIESGITPERIMIGVEAYKRHKPAYADWAYPASWLNQGRWDDQWEDNSHPQIIDWFEECKQIHQGECGLDRFRHFTRKRTEGAA